VFAGVKDHKALTAEKNINSIIVFQVAFNLKRLPQTVFFVQRTTIIPASANNITEPLGTNIPTKKNTDGAIDKK